MSSSQNSNIPTVSTAARTDLLKLVQEHLTTVLRTARTIQFKSKRARTLGGDSVSRLHGADINLALVTLGRERLYGANKRVKKHSSQASVPLKDVLHQPSTAPPPTEVNTTLQWLAVDGVQMDSSDATTTTTTTSGHSQSSQFTSSIQVDQLLQSGLLSEELKLYYSRVVRNLNDDLSIIQNIQVHTGLQELVPFLVQFIQVELLQAPQQQQADAVDRTRNVLLLTKSMILNPNLHLELQLHQLLPVLMTVSVSKQAGTHPWVRMDAARLLVVIAKTYGADYPTLPVRILQGFVKSLVQEHARLGGIVGILSFGHRAVDSFLLPVCVHHYENMDANSQQALLHAISLLVAESDQYDEEVVQVLGESIVIESNYSSCFV